MSNFDNKKIQQIIYIVFITGAALMLLSRLDFSPKPEEKPVQQQTAPVEDNTELRLQRILRTADGVGEVRVLINYGTSVTKSVARNKEEVIGENEKSYKEDVVMGSDSQPVVLRENSREICGVLIVAQGGGNAEVRARIISAVQALLGIEAHKIEVLKMKQ